MKVVSCLSLVLSAGLMACAAGSSAPEGLLSSPTLDSGTGPVILATGNGDAGQAPVKSVPLPDSGTPVPDSGTSGKGDAGSNDAGSLDTGLAVDSGSGDEDAGSGDAGSGDHDAGSGDDDSGSHGHGEDAGDGILCEGYASPDRSAHCTCDAPHQSECQANGCYGGYWCDTVTDGCHHYPPESCQ